MKDTKSETLAVWDIFIRIAHWVLVLAFIIAYLTHEDVGRLHIWSGYVISCILLLRIIWGLIGSQHARFRDFIFSPYQSVEYLTDLVQGKAKRYLGHSPAGGTMVFMLIASLAVSCITGLAVQALEEGTGPLSVFLSEQHSSMQESPSELVRYEAADGDEHNDEHEEYEGEMVELLEELHEFFANLCLFLIVLHVGGVALASFAHRENLVLAMFTGRKPKHAGKSAANA